MNLFKKALVFGDIHFGMKNNSHVHNDYCSDFIDWAIEQAKLANAETCIFLGDWHHIRSTLNISTLNYSLDNLQKLNDAFDNVYFILGNHDLYYKNNRDLNSVAYATLFPNIKIVDEITDMGNCTFVPWLVDEEWKKLKNITAKYTFGHLELPRFKMNAMVEMPDHGTVKLEDFKNGGLVFSGHFHKRQQKDNIYYVGSPFPHNFADAWDDERGIMLLEWGGEPQFINFQRGPKFRTIRLSHLLTNPASFIDERTHAKITLDIDINYEEMNFIKDILTHGLKAKEISIILEKSEELENEFVGEIEFETVDQIVIKQLQEVESNSYDSQLLVDLYNGLE